MKTFFLHVLPMGLLHILSLNLLLVLSVAVQAQTITFDTSDYHAIGVYDTWEQSPFRTGKLQGNAAVIDNHLANDANSSSKIVGVQRSRYGSNTFAVRIDLCTPFRLTKQPRYVHVMVWKPVESRVLVGGLGRRTEKEWQWQDGTCEQFLSSTTVAAPANRWVDVVVPIKGFSYAECSGEGIVIETLFIAPDLESRHDLSEDFACYIDNIEINDNPAPRCE